MVVVDIRGDFFLKHAHSIGGQGMALERGVGVEDLATAGASSMDQ